MRAKKPVAVPAYLREPEYSPGIYGLSRVVRILQIEAKLYRREDNHHGAAALEAAARSFNKIGRECSAAQAFEWPEPTPDTSTPGQT